MFLQELDFVALYPYKALTDAIFKWNKVKNKYQWKWQLYFANYMSALTPYNLDVCWHYELQESCNFS